MKLLWGLQMKKVVVDCEISIKLLPFGNEFLNLREV
jgi:hypothetical protein